MISVIFQYLMKLPRFLFLLAKDFVQYIANKRWTWFEGWGLHIYVGPFGAGKTCSMVNDAYNIARQFPQVTVLTNIKLVNFPAHTAILPLCTAKDILEAPENCLVLIDEIGTIFNSRDFAASKESVPKIVFQHLCQCRKRRMMIYATTQRWNFTDKQLRDIAATVRVTRSHFGHPWTRICTVWKYDAMEYDKAFANPLLPLRALRGDVYLQTDACRSRYDTSELVETMLHAKYLPDAEILANRGEDVAVIAGVQDKKTTRKMGKTSRRAG